MAMTIERRRPAWMVSVAAFLTAVVCSQTAPAAADQAMTDFQIAVLERNLDALTRRVPEDLEPPGETAEETPAVLFGDEIAADAWSAIGAQLTAAVESAVAGRHDALSLALSAEATEAGEPVASARIGRRLRQGRLLLVERQYPSLASDTEKLGPLLVRVWVAPDRRGALELFYLRSGNFVPPPPDRPPTPRDSRFERLAGGPAGGEQHYRLRTQSIYDRPRYEDEPGAGGDRLGVQRGNLLIEVGRDTYSRSEDDPRWRTLGMSEGDESTLPTLIAAIAEQLGVATTPQTEGAPAAQETVGGSAESPGR